MSIATTFNKAELLRQLTEPYKLSDETVDFYQEYGYVKLKNVLSSEVLSYYGEIITRKVFELNNLHKPMEERTTYEKAFLQIMNIWTNDEEVKEFSFSKRLAKIATDLMRVKGVRMYHDQALYKEPGGGITPFHADQFYWPVSTEKTVTVWIPLQDTPMNMGPLAFAEKSHSVEIGRDVEISDESEALLQQELKNRGFKMNETPFELGEVSYHAGWTFHRAGANTSGKPRKVMTVIYMDKDIRLIQPKNQYQVNDRAEHCSDYPVGSVPEGPLNPILFEY